MLRRIATWMSLLPPPRSAALETLASAMATIVPVFDTAIAGMRTDATVRERSWYVPSVWRVLTPATASVVEKRV